MQPETQLCPNCQRGIDEDRYQIHLLMCSSRELRRSRFFHSSPKECLFCLERYDQKELEQHMNNCEHRLVPCEDCQDMFPLSLFSEHQTVCRAREGAEEPSDTQESSTIFSSQLSKIIVKGVGTLGMSIFDKGKKWKVYAEKFYKENLEEKVHELRENYYRKQQQLFQTLEAAIAPLASESNVDGMPKHKIRQLETLLYRQKRTKAGEEQSCPICCVQYDKNEPVKKLKCGHLYHPQCIMQWLQINRTCPVCRRDQMED